MTIVTCYYNDCEFNKDEKCTLQEIAISGNECIACMTAISKEEATEIKADSHIEPKKQLEWGETIQ